MLVIMEKEATQEQIDEVMRRIRSLQYECHPMQGEEGLVIRATGNGKGKHRIQVLECLPGVERVVPISSPYKLASRETKKDKSLLKVNEIEIGNGKLVVMAGPCSVESEEQLMESARVVRIAAPVGVVNSQGMGLSASGTPRSNSATAGAGTLHTPWSMVTLPVPVGTGEATVRSTPKRSQPTADPTTSAIESAAPTSWK